MEKSEFPLNLDDFIMALGAKDVEILVLQKQMKKLESEKHGSVVDLQPGENTDGNEIDRTDS